MNPFFSFAFSIIALVLSGYSIWLSHKKISVDLFEERYKIYSQLKKVLSLLGHMNPIDIRTIPNIDASEMNDIKDKSKFLFNYNRKIINLISEVKEIVENNIRFQEEANSQNIDQDRFIKYNNQYQSDCGKIFNLSKIVDITFKKFLSISI